MDQMQQPESPDQISGKNTGKTTIEVCDEVNMHRGQCLLEPGHDGGHFYRGDVPTCRVKYTGEGQFNLVGRDLMTPDTIDYWADRVSNLVGVEGSQEKVESARLLAARIRDWQVANKDKAKYPDERR